jgi:hypothetical protein
VKCEAWKKMEMKNWEFRISTYEVIPANLALHLPVVLVKNFLLLSEVQEWIKIVEESKN